jgi:DNA-binding transcriptional LysR family regulator
MDIKKYELFADLVETGNFTASAERLGFTQSGVSHIIKGLEKEMGFPLFVRTRRGVELTDSGRRIVPLIRQLLSDHSRLEQTIGELNGLSIGSITIGTYLSISINWLPKIIFEFQKDFPGIDINMKEGGIDDIESWIETAMLILGSAAGGIRRNSTGSTSRTIRSWLCCRRIFLFRPMAAIPFPIFTANRSSFRPWALSMTSILL